MTKNTLNFFYIICIFIFFFFVFKYYVSNQNKLYIEKNRVNIDKNLNKKTNNIPTLSSDTENVIEFNSGFNEKINEIKPRNFWNLFKFK